MYAESSLEEMRLFDEVEWTEDESTEFDPDLTPGSPVLSSDYESIVTDDLDLYEDYRCVCYPPIETHGLKCKNI